MTTGRRRRFPVTAFEPAASAVFASRVLGQARVPYALIGRVAVWTWLPPREQGPTKDVDFAVPEAAIPRIRQALALENARPVPLRIGGLSVDLGNVCVDFIDRHVDGFGPLFVEAVRAARRAKNVADIGGIEVPIVPPEYLIVMKMIPAADKDEDDVVRLLRALPKLSYRFLRALVHKHTGPATASRLDELARKAGRKDAPPRY